MDAPGTVIGRYEIVRRLGRGGMGSVYLARHLDLDRSVALKVLRESVDDQMLRDRFAREARSVARLDHPNIVRIYDFGYHDEQPYLAMEYVAGETLADRLRARKPLPVTDVLRWMEQLCAALEHAHASNIVHRDVKPPNLIISPDGVLKVLDFGIARMAGSTLTDAGLMVGTLNYMSPEQIEGKPVDHRTDIFSAGLVLYEALTGRQAFPGTMQDGVLNAVLKGSPPPVYEVHPGLPAGIGAIVTKAIQKRSANRYQDFGEFAEALRQIGESADTASASRQDAIETLRVSHPAVTPVEEPQAAPTELVLQALYGKDAMREEGAGSTLAYATTVIRKRPKTAAAVSLALVAAVAFFFMRLFAPVGATADRESPPQEAPPPAVEAPKPQAPDPPPSERAADAKTTPAATGELFVDATPWARVVRVQHADGTSMALPSNDITPIRLSVPAGSYTIVLRDQAGATQTLTATVDAGRRKDVTAQFDSISASDYLKGIKR